MSLRSKDTRAKVDPCPCGSANTYAQCCGRWHAGPLHLQAPTAEALMRSRYSAYVRELSPYLLDTWHSSTRPQEALVFDAGLKWLGLEIKHTAVTGPNKAEVEFVARSKQGGRAQRLHENSRFEREDGRWTYVDGDLR